MLGLVCTGNSVPASAATALKATALATGGWGFGGFADPDTTAIAIQALLASGVAKTDPAVVKALTYLKAGQGEDGGWGFDPTQSNAASTAFVVQAFIALGENPDAAAYQKAGVSPVAYLGSQQLADGSFAGFDPPMRRARYSPLSRGDVLQCSRDTDNPNATSRRANANTNGRPGHATPGFARSRTQAAIHRQHLGC